MAHHSSESFDGFTPTPRNPTGRTLREVFNLGATNQFPEGKLTDNDEGEIRVAIGQKDGKSSSTSASPLRGSASPPSRLRRSPTRCATMPANAVCADSHPPLGALDP